MTWSPLKPLSLHAQSLYAGGLTEHHILEVVPEEGIFLAMTALLSAGDHLVGDPWPLPNNAMPSLYTVCAAVDGIRSQVVTAPGYQSLYEVALSRGCHVTPWLPSAGPDGALRFRLEDLAPLLKPSTRLVAVNFPHNPTGAMLSAPEWAQLLRLVATAAPAATLLSDEMYRGLEAHPAAAPPSAADAAPVPGAVPPTVTLCGLSKTYAAPGLRLGWLVTRDEGLMAKLKALKDYTTICGSAPSEILGLAVLRQRAAVVARSRALVEANLALLDAFFSGRPQFRWARPAGGPCVYPQLVSGERADEFCDRVLKGCGVLLLPGSVFHFTDALPGDQQRFRIGVGRASLPRVLAKLGAFLDAQP